MTTQAAWETPQDFFDVVDAEFGFQIDVCATVKNKKCDVWIDAGKDAFLLTTWKRVGNG